MWNVSITKFRNLRVAENCIQEAYRDIEYRDIQRLYFQMQFLHVNLSSAERSNTYSQLSIGISNYQRKVSAVNRKKERMTYHSHYRDNKG